MKGEQEYVSKHMLKANKKSRYEKQRRKKNETKI